MYGSEEELSEQCHVFSSYVADLMEAVKQAYTPSPHVQFVDVIFDIKEWLGPAKVELHNITNPHCFVLKEAANGDVILKYKHWSRDESWKPNSSSINEGVVVLEVSI